MSEQEKNTEQGVHKRRTRYKGKYPRKFEEKYKELQPEKYQDMIAHVIQKGNTPVLIFWTAMRRFCSLSPRLVPRLK